MFIRNLKKIVLDHILLPCPTHIEFHGVLKVDDDQKRKISKNRFSIKPKKGSMIVEKNVLIKIFI